MTQGKVKDNKNAELAVDKDLSTSSASFTDDGAGWINLKFDKTYFIHKVVIYLRFFTHWYHSGNCQQSKANFRACVDNTNNVDVSVYQGDVKQKSCGTLELTYGLVQSDQIYTLLCNTEGDSVKLSKNTGFLVVYEVVTVGFSLGKYFILYYINIGMQILYNSIELENHFWPDTQEQIRIGPDLKNGQTAITL